MSKEFNLLSTLNENKKIIILTTILSVLLMSLYAFMFAQPIYEAKNQVLIYHSNTQENKVDSQDVQANLNLVSTYSKILSSPRVLQEVNNNLENRYSLEKLGGMITVSSESSSQIIEIKVLSDSYREAARIADETASVFKSEIPKLIKVDNVNVLSEAKQVTNPGPIKPRKMLLMILSVLLGIFVGMLIILIRVFTDRTIKTTQDITEVLNIPLLGKTNTIGKKDLA
ncbi:Wzz/FepE/Etk N-terminal domain-containing protein [Enterococcus gilvus]|uniref:YveK family protein n=1 Tax=Enterococcus gilvus TaxID=160453 RepID=UPI0028D4411F|nr:Wzz/FepE/Etk N-terminal domain-containing protein [Enterococcus gilvus]MDU5509436.1 Wzz/FepE/Etk N-terminal domain-containing protein [Enterococcus gilvus]